MSVMKTANIRQFRLILRTFKTTYFLINIGLKTMNKAELIQHIATEAGLNKTQATAALQAFETAVINTLAAGETLELKGFGTFKVTDRAERQGRNPQTGATLTIAASKSPVFKAGKALKDAVN